MTTHWLLAAGFAGMAVAIFFLGWSARIMRVEWRDDRALRAAEARYERHSHRKGDPLPTAGRLSLERLADPAPLPGEPPWLFAGEQDPGWADEAAEYERPHQPEVGSLDWTARKLSEIQADEHVPGVDTPSDFTRRMALDMDMFIKNMVEQSNYDQHAMRDIG